MFWTADSRFDIVPFVERAVDDCSSPLGSVPVQGMVGFKPESGACQTHEWLHCT